MRMSVAQWYEATMSRGIRVGTCLMWPGCTNVKGYGRVRVPSELAEALSIDPRTPATLHRAIYAYHHVLGKEPRMGADPIDHDHDVCRGFACYEIQHLRQVSHAFNQRRALYVRTYGRPVENEWVEEALDGW